MALTASQTAFCVEMGAWLQEVASARNAKAVMQTVQKVMSGQGVSYKYLPGPPWLQGFAFDPQKHDPNQLRALGKRWLPPLRPEHVEGILDRVYDSGKGHTVDHAAGCIIKFMATTGRPFSELEPIPLPPPPPTAEELAAVAHRPFSAGGASHAFSRKQPATKRARTEPAVVVVAQKRPVPVSDSGERGKEAGDPASGYRAKHAPKPPPPPAKPAPVIDLKRPPVPDLDVQEARVLFRNAALVKHLRTHPLGDWVKNPHRKIAGKETLAKTKEKAADAIKGVVREWLLTTPAGRRALAAAEVGEGELSIDRLIARHEKGSMNGLNCIYNLYLMPVRHNAYFGSELTAEKRTYVGERAYQLAKAAHETFVRDTEGEYDWDAGFYKRAENIVNQG